MRSNTPLQSLVTLLEKLTTTADDSARSLLSLRDRALQERIIAKDATNTLTRITKELQPLLRDFQYLRKAQSASTSNPAPWSDRASVLDFQNAKDSLANLLDIANDWIVAHDTGSFGIATAPPLSLIPTNTSYGSNTDGKKLSKKKKYQEAQAKKLVLEDKCHVKHVIGLTKSIQYQLYLVTPKYMKSLVWPSHGPRPEKEDVLSDGVDNIRINGCDEDAAADKANIKEEQGRCGELQLLSIAADAAKEDGGVKTEDLMCERDMVRGMEALTIWVAEMDEEIRREALLDDADLGAMFEM